MNFIPGKLYRNLFWSLDARECMCPLMFIKEGKYVTSPDYDGKPIEIMCLYFLRLNKIETYYPIDEEDLKTFQEIIITL